MQYRHELYAAMTVALGLWLIPAAGAAHGSVPLSEAVTGVSGDENDGNGGENGGNNADAWVLKANFGLITSEDRNHYVCEESFSGGARFEVAVLGLHEWVIFTEDRIVRTDDACDFTEIKTLSRNISDYAADPETGKIAYIINGEEGSELWVSRDRGQSFSKQDLEVSGLHFTQLEFVSGGRIFLSSYVNESGGETQKGTAVLLVVDEEGVRSRTPVEDYTYPYVQAARDDQVAWLAGTPEGQVMVWGTVDSPDGAAHDVKSWPTGAVFEPSGDSLWVAGVGADGGSAGFLHGTRSKEQPPGDDSVNFEFAHDIHSAGCVGFADGKLYACARRDMEDADLERLVDGSFEDLVSFNDLEGPRQGCPQGSNVASTCPTVWPELEKALDVSSGGDAGPSDTGSSNGDAGASPDASPSSDGGSQSDGATGSDGGATGGGTGENTGGTATGSSGNGTGDGCSAAGAAGAANPILVLLSMLTALIVGLLRREGQPAEDD